ncbi:MAG: ATP-binding protein [Actinomycetota bacterium]
MAAAGVVGALSAPLVALRDHLAPLAKGLGFLLVVVLAAAVGSLLNRSRERDAVAEARRRELETLQSLSGCLFESYSRRQSYQDAVHKIVEEFGFEQGSLFVYRQGGLTEQVAVGAEPGTLTPWWEPATIGRSERLPLLIGEQAIGVLVLWVEDRSPLSRTQSRILRGVCDQLALVLEGERLREIESDIADLRRVDSQRKALLVAVSHELQSPLASIQATVTDLLTDGVHSDREGIGEALHGIYVEAERLTGLVANLLDISRIEGGLLEPRLQDVSLDEVVGKAVERVRIHRPGLKIYVSAYESDVVRADPQFLDRVLANLFDNAVRASGTGADRIEVLVTEEGGYAKVAVVDHGEGLPHEGRERLFYPFYELDERHQRLGAGVGLAIVKGFVSLMGGEVWVEDTPGGGATVAFSLPSAGREA